MKDIPVFSLQRLPMYLNYLRALPEGEGGNYISSGAIAKALGLGEVLVRKDLAYTACVGRPKVGYVISELIAALEEYLCCNNRKNAIIVGVGGLGRALLSYNGFDHYGIEMVAAFDNDSQKIGMNISGKQVYSIDDINAVVKEHNAVLAIIAVPSAAAQNVCNSLCGAGVKAILNFAPVRLNVSEDVNVINMDVAANLAVLAANL
jgi:redox-sensing transcriptional repressor